MKYYWIIFLFISHHVFAAVSDGAPWQVGEDLTGMVCQNRDSSQFGPFDYTNAELRSKHLLIVEKYHFSDEVKRFQVYENRAPQANLNYTLSAWPNHHQALISVANYQLLYSVGIKKEPLFTPAECYFQRAIHFSREDGVTYLLYARFLTKMKQYVKAEKEYQNALRLLPDSPVVHYNYGILLLKMRNIEEGKVQAELAKKLGHPSNKLWLKIKAAQRSR